jgi:hypothetical protein
MNKFFEEFHKYNSHNGESEIDINLKSNMIFVWSNGFKESFGFFCCYKELGWNSK